jgi:hypothetical protein
LDDAAREAIERTGLQLQLSGFSRWFVGYRDDPGKLLANESFVDVFMRLNEAGIAFGEDNKGWSPAEIMRELQVNRRIRQSFTAIAWRSPDDWFTTTIEPKQACS